MFTFRRLLRSRLMMRNAGNNATLRQMQIRNYFNGVGVFCGKWTAFVNFFLKCTYITFFLDIIIIRNIQIFPVLKKPLFII